MWPAGLLIVRTGLQMVFIQTVMAELRMGLWMDDIFISYAWSEVRSEWVRLLVGHLRLMGFSVSFDRDLVYGAGLRAFMNKAAIAKHVLLIVDELYVERANNEPHSGVSFENELIQRAIDEHPEGWLAAIAVDNKGFRLPRWIEGRKPKCFDFNDYQSVDSLAGLSDAINDLWRWAADLPINSASAIPPALARCRAERIERIDELRDPACWSSPQTHGHVKFDYSFAPRNSFTIGGAEYRTTFSVSSCNVESVRLYSDYCHAVGLSGSFDLDPLEAAACVTPCRTVDLGVGEVGVLQNENGCLSLIRLVSVSVESFDGAYHPAPIEFDYRILVE